jgi:hypothetical protein
LCWRQNTVGHDETDTKDSDKFKNSMSNFAIFDEVADSTIGWAQFGAFIALHFDGIC